MKIRDIVQERINWNALRQAKAVMPYLYDSPEARKAGVKPNPNEPNIITSVNLKQAPRPGDKLTPLPQMSPAAWQRYMDAWWQNSKTDPNAKEKVAQIRQAAADAKMPIKEFIIMPHTADPMGLIHLPGKGPNNRYGFKNVGNNRGNETKEAPPGTYFTKSGNLVKGRLSKDAKAKGARETDPKDKQRSKVPPVTQSNEARGTCWHGYQQKGYKKKGNKMVPNCVKEEAISENKIKLSKDPNYFGAVGLEKYRPTGPVVNIPIRQLVGFEPDDKMRDPKSMAKVNAIAKAVQDKKTIPPILARKYKNGYQVIDGHHRFWGQRKAGANAIKAQIIPPEDIEEAAGVGIVTKQNATKDVPVGGEYMNVKKLGLGKGKPKTIGEEWEAFKKKLRP